MNMQPEYLVDIEKVTKIYNKGKSDGWSQGWEIGWSSGREDLINNLINSGISIKKISKLTNMDVVDIEKLLDK